MTTRASTRHGRSGAGGTAPPPIDHTRGIYDGDPDPPTDHEPDVPDDEQPANDDEPGEELTAVGAIKLLVDALRENRSPSKPKVHEPDPFDGSNSRKLRTYLVQCRLNFEDRPSSFATGRSKVTYALSYLTGTALQWFESTILDPPEIDIVHWMNDYDLFVDVLKKNFGSLDPEAEAATALENLVMRDNQRIIKYISEFNRLASVVEWDDNSLCFRFYKNLPKRLKDEISRVGKPKFLYQMRDLAQQIDYRYWERDEEIRQENAAAKKSSNSGNPSNSGKDKKSDPPKTSANNNQSSSSSNQKPKNTSSGSNDTSSSNKPAYADKLGKDGKLTPAERLRRITNKLCLFCGQSGHMVDSCPKKADKKARAAQVSTSDSTDSKK